jgi:hypothetical protein
MSRILLGTLVLASVLPMIASAQKRRATELKECFWFDADGDGHGAGMPRCVRKSNLPGAGWVTTGSDCDDSDRRVQRRLKDMVRDCNSNAVAETEPRETCLGNASPFYWHNEEGDLMATIHYPDSEGEFWIHAENARRNSEGLLRLEAPECRPEK